MVVPLLLLAALVPLAAAYPERYGRSFGGWPPLSVYYPPRATRPYYYLPRPQDPYYYPVLPSYYQRPPYYYGYDQMSEPVEDQGDMMEEQDMGDAAPSAYGQETYYTGEPAYQATYQETNDDVNARFLQNLILAQMYSDANKMYGYEDVPVDEAVVEGGVEGERGQRQRWVYGEPVQSSGKPTKAMAKEDEDVRELKSLVRGGGGEERKKERRQRGGHADRSRKNKQNKENKENKENPFSEQLLHKSNDWDEFRSSSYKRSGGPNTLTTSAPALVRGQKEEVMLRPAGAPRSLQPALPLSLPQRRAAAARQPSVYDTIKKLLHREEQLELQQEDTGVSRLQKRSYIPSEDSLVAELGGLKKRA